MTTLGSWERTYRDVMVTRSKPYRFGTGSRHGQPQGFRYHALSKTFDSWKETKQWIDSIHGEPCWPTHKQIKAESLNP